MARCLSLVVLQITLDPEDFDGHFTQVVSMNAGRSS